MDLKLNDDHDLDITEGQLSLVGGLDRIRQQSLIRLKFFRGEWFMDLRTGMPYFQEILGIKPFNAARTAQRFRQALLTVTGVVSVPQVQTSLEPTSRNLSVSFQAVAQVGEETNVFTADFVLP